MKYLLLLVVVLVGFIEQVHSQYGPPNGSFEHWHTVGGLYEEPDFWTTNNTALFTGVVKDSVHPGDSLYSMRVLTNGIATTSEIISNNRFNAFTYNYSCILVGIDTIAVRITYYRQGVIIGGQTQRVITTTLGLWGNTMASPAAQFDSITLMVIGGHNPGTTFNIDHCVIWELGIENIASHIHAHFSPNPMHQSASLRFDNAGHAAYRWILNDAIGRVVAERRGITGVEVRIDRDGLPPGFYCWQLWDERDGGRAAGTLVME